jgi:hypothetical protein
MLTLRLIRPGKLCTGILFLLLYSWGAFSQSPLLHVPDSMVNYLFRSLNDHEEIDRDIAIKYLHLDSFRLQENPGIHSDSSFSFGSHLFWIVSYAGIVNCAFKELIEYNKESRVFADPLELESDCDFDCSKTNLCNIGMR